MNIIITPVQPFDDQRPGTAGLRRPTSVFRQTGYLETYLQAIFEADPPLPGAVLVVGGDGRFFCREASSIAVRMAIANGFDTVLVGQHGLMSTPAASAMVRSQDAHGAIILSASHNPGGADGDFGVKYNTRGGGPASPALTDVIATRARTLAAWKIAEEAELDLDTLGERRLGKGRVVIVDPVKDYLDLLERQFDFPSIAGLLAHPDFRMTFDAMNAVTGPYARALFEERLGAPSGTVLRGAPLPDFGGRHPDPHPHHLTELFADLFGPDPADFGAASDGDGDRNMILGPGLMISPGDSLAVLAANVGHIPAFSRRGLAGVARSMPTSRAVDRVSRRLGFALHETPTGWKFFTNLLDAGLINLCGEESFGTGSDHVREKDGLWAVLFWLSLMAIRNLSISAIMEDHWSTYGRDVFQRHDYEGLSADAAEAIMTGLRARLVPTIGQVSGGHTIIAAEDFTYVDPIDGSVASGQGLRFTLNPDSRITYRLSGTGTLGATLRIYLEYYLPPGEAHEDAARLADLTRASRRLADLDRAWGPHGPSVVT